MQGKKAKILSLKTIATFALLCLIAIRNKSDHYSLFRSVANRKLSLMFTATLTGNNNRISKKNSIELENAMRLNAKLQKENRKLKNTIQVLDQDIKYYEGQKRFSLMPTSKMFKAIPGRIVSFKMDSGVYNSIAMSESDIKINTLVFNQQKGLVGKVVKSVKGTKDYIVTIVPYISPDFHILVSMENVSGSYIASGAGQKNQLEIMPKYNKYNNLNAVSTGDECYSNSVNGLVLPHFYIGKVNKSGKKIEIKVESDIYLNDNVYFVQLNTN